MEVLQYVTQLLRHNDSPSKTRTHPSASSLAPHKLKGNLDALIEDGHCFTVLYLVVGNVRNVPRANYLVGLSILHAKSRTETAVIIQNAQPNTSV